MRETYYDERSWLSRNVWRLAFVALLALILLSWKIYVAGNDDGLIRGRVLDADGAPVADARVELQEKTINLLKQPAVETTDAEGRFEYQDMAIIEFVIGARKEGVGRSERQQHHLYFKGQNYELTEPLVLEPAAE
jgi:hypothetical protein